ncbi:MAG TPA: DUF885 domain-containing protein [Polyangiaceae bacterium]|nr:DUF885 domain-containing protein [Polyangiaceae bacterium]
MVLGPTRAVDGRALSGHAAWVSIRALLSGLALCACAGASPPPPNPASGTPAEVSRDASAGIADPAVADLFQRHWAWQLAVDPEQATQLGVHAYDARIADNSREGIERRWAAMQAFFDEAGELSRRELAAGDRRALELLTENLQGSLGTRVCAFEEWSVSYADNPLAHWNYLPEAHPVTSPESGDALVARYAQIAGSIGRDIENLRRGLARGLVSNRESVRRVIAMFETQLAQPIESWPLLDPVEAPHPAWPEPFLARYKSALRRHVAEQIQPAYATYLAFLRDELLGRAREDERVGLLHLPIGAACYRGSARAFTTLEREPAALHALGLEEIARLDRAIAELGRDALGTASLPETLARLRGDRSLFFASALEIEEKARRALERARAALPRAFHVLPRANCVVARIPDYEAPFSTIAYYRPPVPDGTKPGQYFVNVYQPETRPRFEAAVLAFHESIPGHHLQIAIAQELDAAPAFIKHVAPSAFVEGWALYSERLADELGLYESPLDRLGMLSFDAWRAARLVVDTGLHAGGWSRQRAVQFMLEHTALAPGNVDNEVDRYIVWPGQALAYKVGQLELLALRAEAQHALGSRFDLGRFHDAVLLGGGVTLGVLRRQVEGYVARSMAPG